MPSRRTVSSGAFVGNRDKTQPHASETGGPPPPAVWPWAPNWMQAGLWALMLVACAWGVLEVHSSNDTWIGLAAGRQIFSAPNFPHDFLKNFPKTDAFSFTFYGQTWYNQNWLSHVYLWVLYDWFGPNAVIYGTWAIGAAIFWFVLLATRLRTGSWLAAVLAGAAVGIASRDWLSARPATVQFFLLSALWLCLSALASPGSQRRWWPILLLLLIFGVWPHAHGSFVFGYGLVALFLGCNLVTWLVGRFSALRATITWSQAAAIVAIVAVTAVLGAVLSPFGLENYTHPLKVAESPVFRQIGEWIPPYLSANYPPVRRFWIALAVAGFCPLAALLLRAFDPANTGRTTSRRPVAKAAHPSTVLFDLAAVGLGLGMALFARRFAPTFSILATPALVAWTVRLGAPLSPWLRQRAKDLFILAGWPALVLLVFLTYNRARDEISAGFPADRPYDLLDRVTRLDAVPWTGIEFLRNNGLKPNALTEWTQAGPLFFLVPGLRVYIDGRSQQVYSEEHYLSYTLLTGAPPGREQDVNRLLEKWGTDTVLVRRSPSSARLVSALERQSSWKLMLITPREVLFLRAGTPFFAELGRRERAGELWWPDLTISDFARGTLLTETEPRDPYRAVSLWQSAVARDPGLGGVSYWRITAALVGSGQAAQAREYLRRERANLANPARDIAPEIRARLLDEIQNCEASIPKPPPQNQPGG
jgi:hypothetical protein